MECATGTPLRSFELSSMSSTLRGVVHIKRRRATGVRSTHHFQLYDRPDKYETGKRVRTRRVERPAARKYRDNVSHLIYGSCYIACSTDSVKTNRTPIYTSVSPHRWHTIVGTHGKQAGGCTAVRVRVENRFRGLQQTIHKACTATPRRGFPAPLVAATA